MESGSVLTKQQRIAENARIHRDVAFTSLAYHMDLEWLYEACRRTRKDGAVGVDEQTAEQYEENLERNLKALLERAKAGTYHAPPVRRVHIPKGRNETRPIGIPTFEDKVLQRAVQMLLEPLYEQDFLDCSHGFRPKRSPHTALEALWNQTMRQRGGWVIDLDIRKFFDTLSHSTLRTIFAQRMRDGVIARLIGKWLKAGTMEAGSVSYAEQGAPQGGVLSPLMSNVYLHEVLDRWFAEAVRQHLRGKAFMVRFADDAVLAFTDRRDAECVLRVLPKRFAKYGLTVHPEKTRMFRFAPPRETEAAPCVEGFSFLGFTHYWGRSRKGKWIVKRKTASDRLTRALRAVSTWCKSHRHAPIREQQATLRRKLLGHYAYYGITGNAPSLGCFHQTVQRIWLKWLDRRGGRRLGWAGFVRLLARYPLPPVRVVHSIYAAKPAT